MDEPVSRPDSPVATSPFQQRPPAPEVVVPDLDSMVRWHQHDFPHPLARWHTHPEIEVHHIRSSSGAAFVGDYVGRFEPDHFVLVGSHVPHNWISDLAPDEVVEKRDTVLQLHPDRFRSLARVAPEAQGAVALFATAARGISYTGTTRAIAVEQLNRVGATRGIERLAHVFALLAALARAPEHDRTHLARRRGALHADAAAQQKVDTVLEYITTNLTSPLSLHDAADLVGMSPSALSRFFTRAAGRGFVETVRRLRIMRACRLLDETALRVADICFSVGYENLSNFNRQFRAETGKTPRQYRARAAPPSLDSRDDHSQQEKP